MVRSNVSSHISETRGKILNHAMRSAVGSFGDFLVACKVWWLWCLRSLSSARITISTASDVSLVPEARGGYANHVGLRF